MKPIGDALAAIIAEERATIDPPDSVRAQHWAAVEARLMTPDGGPDDRGPHAKPSDATEVVTAATKSSLAPWLAAAGVALAITGAVTVATSTRRSDDAAGVTTNSEGVSAEAPLETPTATKPSPPPATATEHWRRTIPPPPATAARTPVSQPKAALPPARAQHPTPHASPAATPPSAATESDLEAELRLIDEAARALRARDFVTVLQLTARHRREFATGELVPDRLDLEAAATCGRGNREAGRRLLAEHQTRWPRSPVSELATKNCASSTDSPRSGNEAHP